MAVLAGARGASLGMRVGLLLGLANLLGDGISMGASNYLGLRSEIEQAGGSIAAEAPWRHGLATVAAFVLVGSAPLMAFVASGRSGARVFPLAVLFAAVALVVAGVVRARFVGKTAARSAFEMLAVGTLAGAAAYAVGLSGAALVR
jgi:VIT1/CCC1 family predicted Fe2+/Mn2+ transporter